MPQNIVEITKRLSITTLCVGAVIIGKKYYPEWRLNEFVKLNKK